MSSKPKRIKDQSNSAIPPRVSPDDLLAQFPLLRSDPYHYLALVEACLRDNPDAASSVLFSRYQAWDTLGRSDLALDDVTRSIELDPQAEAYKARGQLLRGLGRLPEAIGDFNRSEALEPEEWPTSYGPFFRADCHARLGNEAAALTDCATLPNDHWTPGPFGLPAGDKAAVTAEIKRRLAAAERKL